MKIASPQVVHHMGALDGHPAPPNSYARIKASLESGAAFIEVDVNALAEGDYILTHEPELDVETSGMGVALDTPPADARGLFIKHAGVVTEYPVALLGEVVKLFLDFGGKAVLQLDFKNAIPFTSEEPLRRLVDLIAPLGSRVIVSSGADWQLRKLRKMAPWLQIGFDPMWYISWQPAGTERDPRDFPKTIGAYGYYDDHLIASGVYMPTAEYLRERFETLAILVPDVSVFYMEHWLLAQSLLDGFNWAEALHERGILLDSWTMDATHADAVEHLIPLRDEGVDLFTTNTPKALAGLLGLEKG